MESARETLFETTSISGWIAEHRPNNLSVRIGKRTFSRFPNNIRYSRGLVEDNKDSSSLIVQSSKSLSVPLRPRNHVDAPCSLMYLIIRKECCRCELEVFPTNEHMEPLAKLGPSLGFELSFCVGGDHASGIGLGGHRPNDNPRHKRRFPNAMPRGCRELDCARKREAVTNPTEDLSLPRLRAFELR